MEEVFVGLRCSECKSELMENGSLLRSHLIFIRPRIERNPWSFSIIINPVAICGDCLNTEMITKMIQDGFILMDGVQDPG